MLLAVVPGCWPVGGLLIASAVCCLPCTRLFFLTEGGLRKAREQTQLPEPKICITIVQIYGNAKIAHTDAIPRSRPGEQRMLCRAATLSAPLSATQQTLPGEF